MNAHKYLKQLYDIDRKIKAQQLMVEELTASVLSISAPAFDKDRVQTSNIDRERTIARLMDMKNKLELSRIIYAKKQAKIIDQISKMGGVSQEILTRRYVKYESFQNIADEMNYSIQRVFQLRRVALNEFERRYLC